MKVMKKALALLLAVMMLIAIPAMAQTVDSEGNGVATITIENPSVGATYKVVKLFDADVTGKDGGSIVYTGEIPEPLKDYFEASTDGSISATDAAKAENGDLSEAAIAALKAWAESQVATVGAASDGTKLTFTGLPYGYYVVVTSQGAAITVTSTNPHATIADKNVTEPGIVKSVDDSDVNIGQMVTYTATATTTNYLKNDTTGKYEIVTKYEISDTLPEFLEKVTVTSIVIDQDANTETINDQQALTVQQFDEKKITILWVDDDGKSLYQNGSLIIVTYTATVTDKAVVDGITGNINVVTLQPYTKPEGGTEEPWKETWNDNEVIYTYATALKKVDEIGNPLAGAKFAANGLTVTGSKGNYTVVSYDPNSTTQGTEMETDDNGHLVIKGLASDVTLTVYETEAPEAYNKLEGPISLPVQKIGEKVIVTSTTVYYDADGEVTAETTETSTTTIEYNTALEAKAYKVENKKGVQLPETGGMGTTILYTIGGVLVAAAVVLLVVKKRMGAEK